MDLAQSLQKLSLDTTSFQIGSWYKVDITHINNPSDFYARLIVNAEHIHEIEGYGRPLTGQDVEFGAIISYESKIRPGFIRGRICYIDYATRGDILFDIVAVDYGFTEKDISMANVRLSPFSHIQPLAAHCKLAFCYPFKGKWTEDVISTMKDFVGTEPAKMIVRSKVNDTLVVEVFNSCPDDIASMLTKIDLALFYSAGEENAVEMPQFEESFYIPFKDLKVGDVLHVRVQSGDSLKGFFVAEVKDHTIYLQERTNLMIFSKRAKPISEADMREGKSIALYKPTMNTYERAIVKQVTVPDSKALVQLVDWGTILEAPIKFMKEIKKRAFCFPATAIYCETEEKQTWDNGMRKFLSPGYEFQITIKQLGDKFNTPNVVDVCRLPRM